jgi:hypothetical protein
MKTEHRYWITIIIAVSIGIIIGWIDSRPHWDDTGITVGLVVISTFIIGFISPRRPWIWAISVGIWIPVWNIFLHNNYGSLIALVIAFIGSYSGAFIRKLSRK